MGLFPKTQRHVEATFSGAKNIADAVDKIATVAAAFGFGDPSGATLTVAGAVSLSAKAVGSISGAIAELAKRPTGTSSPEHRNALVLYIAHEAYFEAIDTVLSPVLSEIGRAEFAQADGNNIELGLAEENVRELLNGRCYLFSAYRQQLSDALQKAGFSDSYIATLTERVTEHAQGRFKELLAKDQNPYSTLRNRLHNEALADLLHHGTPERPEPAESKASSSNSFHSSNLVGLPVPRPITESTEPVTRGVQAIDERLARMERQLSDSLRVQASAASEVSAQLRVNKASFDKAKGLLEVGKLTAAASIFETVAEDLAPLGTEEAVNLRARAIANLGHCHHRQGKNSDAIRLFREAHSLAPNNIRIRVNVAVADLLENKIGAAERALRQLQAEFPAESDVLELLAEAISRRGDPAEALTLLEANARTSEHYLCSLSGLQLSLGKTEDAEKTARDVVQRFPKSHQAQSTLAVAIAAPILNNRDCAAGYSNSDRRRLKAAAAQLETAIASARQEEQCGRLASYLTNLCGIRSALGEHDAAVAAGSEARQISTDNIQLLQNLFAAQFMLEKFEDAVASAREIGRLEPGPDALLREMHALAGANRYEDALIAFENATAISAFSVDSRLLALRVECFRRKPDLDAAEKALAEGYANLGRVMELILQEACMRAAANQHTQADQLFIEAERIATGREKDVARRRYGLYLYGQRRWADAATRLVSANEDPATSIVATEYLQCLFELKRMPEVADIGRTIIAKGKFQGPIWELTAHALAALGQLKDSERLFREMVQHEPTEQNHLALAGVCFRSRGHDSAIKVLEAAQRRHPKSFYVQANLSGLYFARREYRKAFNAARCAVEIAPKRQEGHAAMVRILAAGKDLILSEEEKTLLHRSLTQSKAVRQFQIKIDKDDVDLSEIIEILKEQSEHAQKAMQVYREKRLPASMLAVILSRPMIDIWTGLTRSPTERIFIGSGTYEEQATEHNLANTATDVILDAAALLTLQSLGLLKIISKRFEKIHVATATFEKLSDELNTLRSFAPSTSSMGYENGHIQITEYGPEVHAQKLSILEEIIDFLQSEFVALEGLDDQSWKDWQQSKAVALGGWILHPLLIAKAKGWSLYSDEQGFRALAKQSHGVSSFVTQALLRALVDRQILNKSDYHRAVIKLVESNFDFTSITLDDVLQHLKDASYTHTEIFKKLLRQLQSTAYSDNKSAWILGGLIGHLWFERSADPVDRAKWMELCIASLNSANEPALAMLDVLAASAVQLIHFPEAFTALLHFLDSNSQLNSKARETIKPMRLAAIKALAEPIRDVPRLGATQRWKRMYAWLQLKRSIGL